MEARSLDRGVPTGQRDRSMRVLELGVAVISFLAAVALAVAH